MPEKKSELSTQSDKTVAKTLGDTYRVTVDHTKTLAEMIEACEVDCTKTLAEMIEAFGCGNRPDIIGKNFPVRHSEPMAQTGGGPYCAPESNAENITELVIIQMDKPASTAEVLRYLDENSLRPADIVMLLALILNYPWCKDSRLIVALGSVWTYSDRYEYSPYLFYYGLCQWGLEMNRHVCDWPGFCRFLAVSK